MLDTQVESRRRVVDGGVVRQLWAHPLGRVFAREQRMLTVLEPTVTCRAFGPLPETTLQRLTELSAPSILSVFEIKESAGGRVVAETELVDATPLSGLLDTGRLELPLALDLLQQVAQALAEAHRAEITHGALSTASVLVGVGDDGRDRVWVADFGLGELSWAEHERDAAWVPCSPERTLGLSRAPSEDVYLFGCVAFAALTGSPVFDGSAEEVRRRHAIEDALSVRRTPGGGDIPRSIATLVARCLAKDPEDRFADGDELHAAMLEARSAANVANTARPRAATIRMPAHAASPDGAPETAIACDRTLAVETELASVVRPLPEADHAQPVAVATVMPPAPTVPIPTASVALPLPAVGTASRPEPARPRRIGLALGIGAVLVAGMAIGWPFLRDPEGGAAKTAGSDEAESIASVASSPSPAPEPASEPVAAIANDPGDDGDDEPVIEIDETDAPPAVASGKPGRTAPRSKARAKRGAKRAAADAPASTTAPARSVSDLLAAAKAASAKGERKEAEGLYAEVLERDRDHAGALEALGTLRFNRGDYRGAAKVLAKAVDASPKDAELRIRLGDAHFKLEQYDKARTQFTKAKELGHSAADRRLERTDAADG